MLVAIILWVYFYKLIIYCLCKLSSKCYETLCWKALNVFIISENIKTNSSTLLETFREIIPQLFLIVFFEKSLVNHSDLFSNDFYLLENKIK